MRSLRCARAVGGKLGGRHWERVIKLFWLLSLTPLRSRIKTQIGMSSTNPLSRFNCIRSRFLKNASSKHRFCRRARVPSQAEDAGPVLHGDAVGGAGVRQERGAGGERAAGLVVIEHSPVDAGPLGAPRKSQYPSGGCIWQRMPLVTRVVSTQAARLWTMTASPRDRSCSMVSVVGTACRTDPRLVCKDVFHGGHPEPVLVREHLDHPAAGALAGPAEPPCLLGLGDVGRRQLPSHVDDEVAELVGGLGAAARADEEEPVRTQCQRTSRLYPRM